MRFVIDGRKRERARERERSFPYRDVQASILIDYFTPTISRQPKFVVGISPLSSIRFRFAIYLPVPLVAHFAIRAYRASRIYEIEKEREKFVALKGQLIDEYFLPLDRLSPGFR